ncbi:putative organic hydroperoxide resistance protein [Coemansia reversa NRRL 1564]|uniref:Putative organic hydroperoxide resistance protein n=1 Tax=Coemansia reversa (strain ATCC 12441 / NRRL 1564) TaxID=763665 RepID=A0A2G5BHD7_COERN|nr:putative organic hydroperoxide resistance protein [Coemansia reversa NRRL 1564]|eukprot:PIA18423.1 putative organic hydroperoxide resistance protein [Coemansia reversa NRRL 1564]
MYAASAPAGRRFITINPIYTAEVTATGGRNGHAVSSDKVLDVGLTLPKELGGPGLEGKVNPEQLFAASYSACFQGAMGLAAKGINVELPESNKVTAAVGIGKHPQGGFGLLAELRINIPGLDKATALKVVEEAHRLCPYSRAIRDNVEVKLVVV